MPSMKRKRIPQNPNVSISRKFLKAKRKQATMSVNPIPRTLKEFPKQMRVQLKYSTINQLTVTAGPNASFFPYRCNSIFDPDALVGGQQPRGASQWAQFYKNYHVVGSRCSIRLLDVDTGTSTAGTVTGLFGIRICDSAAPTDATVRSMIEDSDSVYKGYDSWHANTQVTKPFHTASYFGISNLLDNNQLGGATGGTAIGSNPVEQAFFLCWASQAPASGAVAQVFQLEVMLTYDVIYSDPADLTAS